jgi:hypothetical protein
MAAKLIDFTARQVQQQGFYVSGFTGIQGGDLSATAYDLIVVELAVPGTPGSIQINRVSIALSNVQPDSGGLFTDGPLYVRYAIIRGDFKPLFLSASVFGSPTGYQPYAAIGPGEWSQGSTVPVYDESAGAVWRAPSAIAAVLHDGVISAGPNVGGPPALLTWPDDPADPSALIVPTSQGVQLIVLAPIQPPAASFAPLTNVCDVAIGLAIGTPPTQAPGLPLALPRSTLSVRN